MRVSAAILYALAATLPGGCAVAADHAAAGLPWLSDSIHMADPGPRVADAPAVTVAPIGTVMPDRVGIVPAAPDLPGAPWQRSHGAALGAIMGDLQPPRIAPMQALLADLLAMPPGPAPGIRDGLSLALARIDGLLAIGRLDLARGLLEQMDLSEPALMRRAFDVALLSGRAEAGCARLLGTPGIEPAAAARAYCTSTPEAETGPGTGADPGTPLGVAIRAARGEPVVTVGLPISFAHGDLGGQSGWRTRLQAAERLARAGALPSGDLWAIYAERAPAASGGVWERVAAVQEMARALQNRDAAAAARILPGLYTEMAMAGLLPPLAEWLSAPLGDLGVTGGAPRGLAALAGHAIPPQDDPFLAALLGGGALPAPHSSWQGAAAAGLTDAAPPRRAAELLSTGRSGEALILAVAAMDEAAAGSLDAFRNGLAILRAAGLDHRARAAALHILVTAADE